MIDVGKVFGLTFQAFDKRSDLVIIFKINFFPRLFAIRAHPGTDHEEVRSPGGREDLPGRFPFLFQ